MLSTSSSPHSHSHSGEPAGSRSHSSVLTSNYSPTPCATPLPGMGTAISPGPSLASSSRPTTPGPALSYPPSLQQYLSHGQRVSWPRYDPSASASTSEEGLERRGERERRPSRLSLTLANWNPETDPELDLSVLKPEDIEKAKTTEGESRGAKGDERQRDQEKEKDTDGSQQASDLSQLAHAASSGHVSA
ncbi:uncharacterized protein LAESUDRAFT_230304 [Laetiporus sulphureus 93-53]|uniref:Uncharacterized protein n=1 Tax=Laetiporus sulphureus 93-53 TaxID=1314785 RepID=A0A165DQT9_9APHY|nr:uncharacterized protein LAESUDRAFT_230304 [Laetiporus sulphureus 93-53]KZT05428.1 hypothetical protein LAESUDRAFT_230304 [Laetiporus sulphureus 93-53]